MMELCGYNKAKEFLAQGMGFVRYQDRNPEQEKMEKKRQLPFHMHVPLDYLDISHLISAMLLEIPNMLHQLYNPSHKRFISKALRRHLENWDKNMFQTPPETPREHVVAAARALYNGDWEGCKGYLEKVRCINEIVSDPEDLWTKLRKEALRCYCLRYQYSYQSLQLEQMGEMFELPSKDRRGRKINNFKF